MSNSLLSLFLAAGVGAFIYSRLGKRIGYGNTSRVWLVIGITFVMSFIVIFITLSWIIKIKTL